MLIQTITQRLHELSATLSATDTLDAEHAYIIASFFRDFGESNAVINEAVELANNDADQLYTYAQSLISVITEYEGTDKHALLNADFKMIVDEHIKTFEAPHKDVQVHTRELRHKWLELSKSLDNTALDSEEYKQLDAECDKAHAEYNAADAELTTLYNMYRAKKSKWRITEATLLMLVAIGGSIGAWLGMKAWQSMMPFVMTLAHGGGNFYDGWMKNPHSTMISCNDGFRPVSFYIETIED